MNTIRNFFVLACIGAILFAFLYAARPEWFSGIIASGNPEATEVVIRKTTLTIPAQGRSAPVVPEGTDLKQLVEMEDDGVPSRVNPYILVVNSNEKTMRHYRLSNSVKSVTVRSVSPEVVVKKSKVIDTNGPIQLEIWIANNRELTLEVEYQTPKR